MDGELTFAREAVRIHPDTEKPRRSGAFRESG